MSLSPRLAAIVDAPFDLAFAVRVGAFDGRHQQRTSVLGSGSRRRRCQVAGC